ncbi:uncharacterized protein LOC127850171 [Dreissena polymorpha]|uniref:Uncharacterized protein n=1 Tax=Dreissena polymorpha TaxID=45954 RepID=A0A9D4CWJ0_DREPO|nr:uncharacterized protein LOC127850171 [Dreissena polymorpha]KAH3733812.1 hypothetical protein DPMN_040247 [Dreissena polymorpha]
MAKGGIGHTESESDSFDRHISLYSRHSRDYVESVSKEICSVMTRLGYGEEIRRWRIEKYREMDRLSNARRSDITKITAGSKAEGLTCLLESDIDVLFVQNGVLCVEFDFDLHTIPDDIGLFRMDTSVYPGHCRLPQERQAHTRIDIIHNALWDNGYGEVLLVVVYCLMNFLRHFHLNFHPECPNINARGRHYRIPLMR